MSTCKNLTYGPVATVNTIALGPDQSVAVADSLYFTGLATTGFGDVLFGKMLSDGTMVDSCGFVDSLLVEVTEIQNPVRTPIILQELITSALATDTIENWTADTSGGKTRLPGLHGCLTLVLKTTIYSRHPLKLVVREAL